jgi:membrane associated rhomboid family serine protease
MGDSYPDPVDHVRTTRPHAGETVKNGANVPGLISGAVAVVLLVSGLFAFAAGHSVVGVVCVVGALVLGVVAAVWVNRTHRKVRAAEQDWLQKHPEAPAQPPSS